MGLFIQDNGKMISIMDKELKYGTIDLSLWETIIKGKKRDKESKFYQVVQNIRVNF